MEKKWLNYINLVIGIALALLVSATLAFLMARPSEISTATEKANKRVLPKGAFTQTKEAYETINQTIFKLKYSPITFQLPDLRKQLIYYGKNDRPDAKGENPVLHFSFQGNKTITSVLPGEKKYVSYDRSTTPPQYIFSPGNSETPLWIQVFSPEKEANVKVSMRNENGEIIQEPWAHAQFTLPPKDFVRTGTLWEIGKWRVDGSLLARQKARWYGLDKFLEKHGGKEFTEEIGKQRIDLGEGDQLYSVYIGSNDGLIWDNDKWKVAKIGPETLGYPLLLIKKIDDRLMQLELWDINGQSKIALNLLKSTEPWNPQVVLQSFKFLGSRTRSQFVFEVNKERMLLSPKDWLVLTANGWKKLSTPQDIDDYVDRKITGILFVFDGIQRKGDQQFLTGTLYNASRSDAKPVEIAITPAPIGRRKTDTLDKKEDMPELQDEMILPPSLNGPIPPNIPMIQTPPKKFEHEKAMQPPSGL